MANYGGYGNSASGYGSNPYDQSSNRYNQDAGNPYSQQAPDPYAQQPTQSAGYGARPQQGGYGELGNYPVPSTTLMAFSWRK
ncbi:MAG: hypothetical protein Q9182_003572 [Xanthomendoza sp. 2 TL-2023]